MSRQGQLQPYSDGYYILDAEVMEWPGEHAIIPHDLSEYLERYVRRPVFHIGNHYFVGYGEAGVPADTIVVPEGKLDDENKPVLVAKNEEALDLVHENEVEDWRG